MEIVITSIIAWTIAQTIKVVLRLVNKRQFDWRLFFSSGGFPSAHSAFVTSICAQIGFMEGIYSSIFALAFGFWCVVVYDSFGVRRAVGIQAQVLNRIQEEVSDVTGEAYIPIKEILGHTPIQVFFGVLLGLFIAWLRIEMLL